MKSTVRALIIGSIAAGSLLATSCSNKITEEQLAQLKELRKQEASLNDKIESKEKSIARTQTELNEQKAKLKNCDDLNALLETRLKNWPNSWPDYTEPPPAPPVETPVVPEKPTHKKKR